MSWHCPVHSKGLEDNAFLRHFQLLDMLAIPYLLAHRPPSVFESCGVVSLSSSYMGLCDHVGLLDNPIKSLYFKILNLMMSTESLLPCEIACQRLQRLGPGNLWKANVPCTIMSIVTHLMEHVFPDSTQDLASEPICRFCWFSFAFTNYTTSMMVFQEAH